METGYCKADNRNLPVITTAMIHSFYCTNPDFISAEIKNVKSQRSSRSEYGDEAIGYVQLKREDSTCIVKAKITPEHKVREKGYRVRVIINEEEQIIENCICEDCTASQGSCKHSVAILFWLYRRSQEPAPTEVECYWRCSRLSKIGKSLKAMTIKEMFQGPTLPPKQGVFLQEILRRGKENGSESILIKNVAEAKVGEKISLHFLSLKYLKMIKDEGKQPMAEDFITFCKGAIQESDCLQTEIMTKMQSKSASWFEARYCRITASKLYEVARCKSESGSLVERIFGSYKVPETEAMVRGLTLEDKVLKVLEKTYSLKIARTGFKINKNYPLFGASPDGVTKEHVIEIKCPIKNKTVKNYIIDGKVQNKPYAQMQLQMFLLEKKKALFVMASPNFEKNQEITVKEVEFNDEYIKDLILAAEFFWKTAVFPKLIK